MCVGWFINVPAPPALVVVGCFFRFWACSLYPRSLLFLAKSASGKVAKGKKLTKV
jgi:hypothetical protein